MSKTSLALAIALTLWPAAASAQLALDALAPAGLDRVEIDVPVEPELGVRLYFAPAGERVATLGVEVHLAPSAAEARRLAAAHVAMVSGELAPLAGIGERAWGEATHVAFVRGDAFVVVRRLRGEEDCRARALELDQAIVVAPRRAPPAVAVALPDLGQGATPVALPPEIVAAHVIATGSAAARRTRSGWVVVRRGGGPWSVRLVACDAWLRRADAARDGR